MLEDIEIREIICPNCHEMTPVEDLGDGWKCTICGLSFKKDKKMERKTVKFELKDLNEEAGTFEGYGSTFTSVPDSYGDVVDKGAFAKTIQEGGKRIKILWNHDTHEPIGKPIELSEDETGLKIKGKLSLGVQRAREVLALMKDGVINEMSIGYDAITEAVVDGVRHLKEVRLWDVSPVTFAANPSAVIISAKSADVEKRLEEVEKQLKALRGPEGQPIITVATLEDEAALKSAINDLNLTVTGFDKSKAERRIEELLSKLGE